MTSNKKLQQLQKSLTQTGLFTKGNQTFLWSIINRIEKRFPDENKRQLVYETLTEVQNLKPKSKEPVKPIVKLNKEDFVRKMLELVDSVYDNISDWDKKEIDKVLPTLKKIDFDYFAEHIYSVYDVLECYDFITKSEVSFDNENLFLNREKKDKNKTKSIYTYELTDFYEIDKDNCVLLMAGGGDWELPVCNIMYWNGEKFTLYTPTAGNFWHPEYKEAYGNVNDELTEKMESSDNIYDTTLMLQEFVEKVVNVNEKKR